MKKARKVLIIDDDETTCYLNRAVVEEMQIAQDVLTFTNAWNALTYIVENLQGPVPAGTPLI